MKGLWLYLHFPQLQLDSLMSQPAYQADKGLLIMHTQHMQVLQCNHAAQQLGITQGMSLAAAATLCAELQVHAYDESIEADKRMVIADKLYGLSCDICLFAHNGLLLRAHSMIKLYGSLNAYWLAIQHQLNQLNITYYYATATTPLAAKLLALKQCNWVSEDRQKIQQQVLSSRLSLTDLDAKTIHKLNKVGIHQVKQLLAIPLADIAKRFNPQCVSYLSQLQGNLPHPLSFYHPAEHFQRYMELLYEVEHVAGLLPALGYLLNAMQQFLILRDQLAMHLVLYLHQRDSQPLQVSVSSQQGEYKVAQWQYLIELQLQNVRLSAPVFALSLSIDKAHLRTPDSADLFQRKRSALSRLQLIAILQAKLGEHAVASPVFNNSYIPEQASTLCSGAASNAIDSQAYAMRPIFLLPKPTPLSAKVAIQHGPERIQSAWWQDTLLERDYFIARSDQGQWLWVFRTPQQEWFLHGVFS